MKPMTVNTESPRYNARCSENDFNKKGVYWYVKLSFTEGQSSLLAVWAIFPLSHLALISTSDITKCATCKRDKLSNGQS